MLPWFVACAAVDSSDSPTGVTGTGRYELSWSADPPFVAGAPSTLSFSIVGPDGSPAVLQETHERIVHVSVVSADLQSFQLVHPEDAGEVTQAMLDAATFSVPVTLPAAGETWLAWDYAAENQYLQTFDTTSATGTPAELAAPVEDGATERDVDGLHAALSWEIAPIAGYEAAFDLTLTTPEGDDVTDLVQVLGSDGSAYYAPFAGGAIGHTHAWIPDLENAPPGTESPHLYAGPTIPFHCVFGTGGRYQAWFQVARAANPDAVYTIPFQFEVSG